VLDGEFRQGTLRVTVDITEELPEGVRTGLSVDGQIEVQTVPDVLYVGRPAYAKSNSEAALFKIVENGEREAVRVPVQFGLGSVNMIVVDEGLEEGDTIILSDMSRWDAADRVRLQ
jgi:multidrug efflux pump subunit AcrA (membrane-fusion protein)